MGLNYSGFKAHLVTFLWRDGDTVLIANLDSLVTMANNELNRMFLVEDRAVTVELSATSNTVATPPDYRQMRSLSAPGIGPLTYLSPTEFARQDAYNGGSSRLQVFTISNGAIRLSGGYSVEAPQPLVLVYYADIPAFKDTDASWVADDYLDIYTYCALKHAAPFLREDDRLPVWSSLYKEALTGALEENASRKYAGSPLRITYGGMG